MRTPLEEPGLLFTSSKDPDAKVTFLCTGPDRLAVKVPTTQAAERAVEAEAHVLVALRRMGLGAVDRTVPRYVASPTVHGRRALVSSALPGRPLTVDYHSWHHTARRAAVRTDLQLAASWLEAFHSATEHGDQALTWPGRVAEALHGRWDGDPLLDAAAELLTGAVQRLGPRTTPATAVHGDYWFGNLLVEDGAITGVVDWEGGEVLGCPLRDVARFPLSYALYLDRHTAPGAPVTGHRGLRRGSFGAGVRHALLGSGWFPDAARGFLASGVQRLGLPRGSWYDVALVGLADIAATANDDAFGHGHLTLLAGLPEHPRGHRRRP